MSRIRAADLFCGAGGTSTGLYRAAAAAGRQVDLLAVNHWEVAVETHAANHPSAQHVCATLDGLDPKKAVPKGRLNLLIASPECVHHSNARGGRPMSDQSRASAWHVVHWAERLRPDAILVENVREFASWGPLDRRGRPVKSRKGETFAAWIAALRSQGYVVDWRVLNAADYGDPTTRQRLFVIARRGRGRIRWPEPSHEEAPPGLFAPLKPWRAAREVIDWDLKGTSIFGRTRPLAEATLRRIEEGLRRFGGAAAEPFLVLLRGTGGAREVGRPVPALTAGGTHVGLCEPFVLQQQSGGAARPVEEPLPAVAAKGAISLVQPFLVPHKGERGGQSPRSHSVEEPVPTVCASGPNFSLVEPYLVQVNHGGDRSGRQQSTDRPVPTLCGSNSFGLVEPFLVEYYGNGGPKPTGAPLPTQSTRDRFALVEPRAQLDILFRMLQPHELARAMSFPEGYRFAGTKTDVIRQIGNAVPVSMAEALCRALLEETAA